MTALIDEGLIERELGSEILAAAKANDHKAVLLVLLRDHPDVVTDTDSGALFAGALARRVSLETGRDILASEFGIFLAGRLPAPELRRA
jgi:hypothetical protein